MSSRPRISVTASLRASGYDDLPDTFYLLTIPDRVRKIGVGSRLLIRVGFGLSESIYAVTLGHIRVRGDKIVEFIGHSNSFLHGICYVQIPVASADVSKFPILDFIRGRFSTIDPIPDRYVRRTRPVNVSSVLGEDLRDGSIEIRVDVESLIRSPSV